MSDSEHIHEHPHVHHHEHGVIQSDSPEETRMLLAYMLSHNEQHTKELHEIAHIVPEKAAGYLHEAVSDYERGNNKLAQALELLEED